MPQHSESRIVPYPTELMYNIVSNVEKYPEFLPWCSGLRVLACERVGGNDHLIAEMLVGFSGLHERYISRVALDPAARTIDVTQLEGPFRHMDTHWRFTPEGDGCKVDFSISFEFKNRLLAMVAGKAFERVMLKMTEAFESRARALSAVPT